MSFNIIFLLLTIVKHFSPWGIEFIKYYILVQCKIILNKTNATQINLFFLYLKKIIDTSVITVWN